jgi:hypothetical protein
MDNNEKQIAKEILTKLYYYSQQGKDYQEQLFKFSELLKAKYLLHSELFAKEALQRIKDGL